MIHAVIMAGGGGTRFWPRSRAKRPKQFLSLSGDRSLLQQAQDRLEVLIPPERTWIITSEQHKSQVREQLPHIPGPQIIGEPVGRDTAPCVALGAALIHRQDPEAVIVVTPADHVIEPAAEFHRALNAAVRQIESSPEALLTFGIPPTFPATGYGYIHRDVELGTPLGVTVNKVAAFKEKPKPEIAQQYVASGAYFWNSGIFVWRSATILRELQTQQPAIHDAVQQIAAAWGIADFAEVFWQQYNTIPKISIDFAVMEHSQNVLMIQAPFRWDDVGSWLALERMNPQDADGNTVLGNHLGIRTSGCILSGEREVLIATIGVKDLLIIQDGDAILVADKKEEGTVRQIVEALKTKTLEKYL
jgi:mannose-1-phosphate guanylyltransferase